MNNCFIILAAGQSKRFKSKKPKQYTYFKNKPLYQHSIDKILKSRLFKHIILVVNNKKLIKNNTHKSIKIINGGIERSDSSFLALKYINKFNVRNVLIHDAARPNFSLNLIKKLLFNLKKSKAVIPFISSTDSIKYKYKKKISNLSRNKTILTQTPQAFRYVDLYKLAKKNKKKIQDEASLFIEENLKIKVEGMLDQLLGKGNSSVQIAVDINFDQTERTSEIYDAENPSIISEEKNSESGLRIDSTSYNNENSITNYELNKTIEHFVSGSAKIERITVAALVNGKYENVDNEGEIIKKYLPRNNEEKDEIAGLIKQTIGFDNARGDEVKVANLEFDRSEVEKAQMFFNEMERKESMNKWISRILMILALAAMMFFVVNLTHAIPGPPSVELEEAEATLGLEAPEDMLALTGGSTEEEDYSELEDGSGMPDIPRPEDHISTLSLEAEALLKAKDIMTDDISNFVDVHPDSAAKLIRTWLAQDKYKNVNKG
mgnify:CR=1 FL=1